MSRSLSAGWYGSFCCCQQRAQPQAVSQKPSNPPASSRVNCWIGIVSTCHNEKLKTQISAHKMSVGSVSEAAPIWEKVCPKVARRIDAPAGLPRPDLAQATNRWPAISRPLWTAPL